MLDCTDRHDRYFLRLLSQHAFLYTEMVTSGAILHGDRDRHLQFCPEEHPLALQLGGSDPVELARCARLAQAYGYDEVNLNVGCPSERVQSGAFGACLMAEPELVAECVAAMSEQISIPVTVKHRIGIDERDSWEALCEFVETVATAGCHTFIVHARKAWLQGLSPKENRTIPPLIYDTVYRLKQTWPQLEIIINGGITDIDSCLLHLQKVDGVMLGREAYHNPWILTRVDAAIYQQPSESLSRFQVLEKYAAYMQTELGKGTRLHIMSRHLMGLFNGMPGAKLWRRTLGELAPNPNNGIQRLLQLGATLSENNQSVA